MEHIAGIDIGGTNTKIAILRTGEQFKVLKQTAIATQPSDPANIYMKRIAQATRELANSCGAADLAGAGVGCPGLVDPWRGTVHTSPNMPNLVKFPLQYALSEAIGLPVAIQNDANAAVLGEFMFGPNSGCRNMILLTLGTGVGGGVICDGHLVEGADNAATELGHLKVDWSNQGPLCGCGKRGCVEAYVGAAGIARLAEQLLAGGAKSQLMKDKLTTKDIATAAAAGDAVACEALSQAGQYLGRCIALLLETFNPERVVLGGGASAAIEFLRPGIEIGLDQFASFEFTRRRARIERSAFPDDINVIGAAATLLNARRRGTQA